jgi:hypothetical protein
MFSVMFLAKWGNLSENPKQHKVFSHYLTINTTTNVVVGRSQDGDHLRINFKYQVSCLIV